MKETTFIDQQKEKWKNFEDSFDSGTENPEKLTDLYMDITDDLSYAQTFYKRRTVRVYLNNLSRKVFEGVNRQKKDSFKNVLNLLQYSLPLEIYRARKNLMFAFFAFLVYTFIGVITTHFLPDFPRIVMGDQYVEMTLKNIKHGNPLAVYQQGSQLNMFIMIASNNLKVSFLTFFIGFFLTIGTHILLFYNSVMLGAFQYFFKAKGLLLTSFLGIWIHGAFEISSIVIAAGAGITAGNGFLFPGSYSRVQGLQLSAKRGLKIMLSLVPFIITAGFLESYVTRNYQSLGDIYKAVLIILSFSVILFFYVIYPFYVARSHPEMIDDQKVILYEKIPVPELHETRNAIELIRDSYLYYSKLFFRFSKPVFAISLPVGVLLIGLQAKFHVNDLQIEHLYDWKSLLEIMFGYGFKLPTDFLIASLWTLDIAFVLSAVFYSLQAPEERFSTDAFIQFLKRYFLKIWIFNLLLNSVVFVSDLKIMFFVLFLIPFLFLLAPAAVFSESDNWKKGFKYGKGQYSNTLVFLIVSILVIGLFVQPIASFFSNSLIHGKPLIPDFLDMLVNLVKRIAGEFTDQYVLIGNLVRQFVYLIVVLLVIPLAGFGMAVAYNTEKEKTEAISLKEAFTNFGKRSRFREKPEDFE